MGGPNPNSTELPCFVETNVSGLKSHESKVGFAEFRGALGAPSLEGPRGDGDPGKGLGVA